MNFIHFREKILIQKTWSLKVKKSFTFLLEASIVSVSPLLDSGGIGERKGFFLFFLVEVLKRVLLPAAISSSPSSLLPPSLSRPSFISFSSPSSTRLLSPIILGASAPKRPPKSCCVGSLCSMTRNDKIGSESDSWKYSTSLTRMCLIRTEGWPSRSLWVGRGEPCESAGGRL